MTKVEVFANQAALIEQAAERLVALAEAAIERRGSCALCLSGGNTPRPLYERIASEPLARRVAWDRVQLFFGDERCVPPHDLASNYHMVRDALLARVPLPEAHVHRIRGELDPADAAAEYERMLRAELGVDAQGGPLRPFDLVLLGLGDDGHTASLFPHSVDDAQAWAAARLDPPRAMWRVTLLPRVLGAADAVWFLVAGANKAERVVDVLEGPARPDVLPAQRIRPSGSLHWLLDRAAGARLLERASAQNPRGFALEVRS